jgi:hypothetical protein
LKLSRILYFQLELFKEDDLMQENIRLVMWTIVSIIAVFMHVDKEIAGTVPYIRTDIGSKCGENLNSTLFVEYKLNTKGQIIYLCPQGVWPIQKQVVADVLSPELRQLIGGGSKLELLYPSNAQVTPAPVGTPAATTDTTLPTMGTSSPSIAPSLDSHMAAPHLAAPGLAPPKEKSQTPAAPAQNANPFIGAPAPAAGH